MFQAPKLTNAGKALYYDNIAGTQLKFTTIKLGSGILSRPIANLTNLVNTVVTITALATATDDYVNIAGAFSNAQLYATLRDLVDHNADPEAHAALIQQINGSLTGKQDKLAGIPG